jgi:hypothetical protein
MKEDQSYLSLAYTTLEKVADTSEKEAKAVVTSAITKIDEISKQIESGSITPQQAETATQGIIASVTETPGISQSNINALRKVAAKEENIAKSKEAVIEDVQGPTANNKLSTPMLNDQNKLSKSSGLSEKINEFVNNMMKKVKVIFGSSSPGELHPDSTPKEGLQSARKAQKDSKSKS